MRTIVLGGSGGIGRAVAVELHARGHDLVTASRSPARVVAGVEHRSVDLTDRSATVTACRDTDVVMMAAQPPYPDWVTQWPDMLEHVLAGAGAAGARLVLTDNLYALAPATGVLTEESPEHATDPKGLLRRRLADTLRAAHDRGRVRTAVGRFSDYYGPSGTNSGLYVTGIEPALAGRRPRGFVDLDQPHTFHHLPDAARGFATLVEDERADGHTWILPAAPATTQRALLDQVASLTGAPTPGVIRPWMFAVGGLFDAMIRESRSVVVQYDRPWVTDASRFEATFGTVTTTPHDEAVATTVAAFRRAAVAAA